MIQIITYTGKEQKYNGALTEQYSIHDVRSLDEYDVNIIDLNDNDIWKNKGSSTNSISIINDFISLSTMISNSKTSKTIILLPQNKIYRYNWGYERFRETAELKNMLITLVNSILSQLYEPISTIRLVYENTKTQIGKNEYSAAFYFQNESKVLLKSIKSGKATTIKCDKVILSTLAINSYDALVAFLKELHLLEEKEPVPEWLFSIKMFNDNEQETIIRKNEEQISVAENNIENANHILQANSRLKSTLYTNGDSLVEVVFEILEEMLDCDLSNFVDEKNADFIFEIDNTIFIGEIKGVSHNVKNENVSQLEVHYQRYLDEHPDTSEESIVALLIMNHQKNKPLLEREPIMGAQVDLAKRYGSLIIETHTLLKLLENYRAQIMTRGQIIQLLKETTGCLSIN